MRRAVVASTVGSVIESYDFLLYVLIAPLVFAKLYFPSSDPLVGTLQAFGIYAVGFISRPLGAAFFGHYGDRIGRKVTLIATLLITGLATFAVGFVPGYASIGIWGAIILTGIRFIQGIGVGGEWGGATWVAMGVGEDKCPSRLHHRVAAMGCSGRIVRREYRRPRIQRDFRRSISGLGLARAVLDQHRHGRNRAVDPPRHPRNAGVPAHSRSAGGGARASNRGASPAPKGDHPDRIGTNGTAGSILYLRRLHLHLRDNGIAQFARPAADRGAGRHGGFDGHNAAFGLHIRPHRPQAPVPDRRGGDGNLGLRLFRDAQHDGAGLDLPSDRRVTDPARHDVRAAGGVDRRMLQPAAALHRRLARLSSSVAHRRWAGAADRDRSPRQHPARRFGGDLLSCLRRR